MLLELFAVLVIAFAAYSHYRSGLWRAVLTLWSALLAGAVAFGFYLPLSRAVFGVGDTLTDTHAYWGDGLTLLLLFIVTFGVLRVATEQLLRNAMPLKALVDGIGGAVVGAAAGYVMAGVLAVFAQMMPLSPTSVLGYQPYDLLTGERTGRMMTRADERVLGLYNAVLGGALSVGDGNLASRYPASDPAAVAERDGASGGVVVDDILRYYFRRRFEYAVRTTDELAPFTGHKRRGVAVVAGPSSLFSPGRGIPDVRITVRDVKMVPYRQWAAGWREVTPGQGVALVWATADGGTLKVPQREEQSLSVLLVDLTFRPETEDAYSLSLGDWELASSFRSTGKNAMSLPRAKLWGAGKAATSATKTVVTPVEAIDTEKSQAILDGASVTVEGWQKATGGDEDADAVFVANTGVWNFDGSSRKAKATLAFVVPSLSMTWQYGLKCGGAAVSAKDQRNKEGLFKGRRVEAEPFKIRIIDAQWLPTLPGVGKEAASGAELAVVTMELVKSDKNPVLLTADNWELKNLTLKQSCGGALLETVKVTDGEPEVNRSARNRNTDIMVEGAKPVMTAGGERGQQLSEAWEMYFQERSAKVEVKLVFEVPRGRRSDRYTFAVSEKPSAEAPEWYLLRNVKPIGSRTQIVELVDHETREGITVQLSGDRVREMSAGQIGGQDILVLTVSIGSKDADDRYYYELDLSAVQLKATKGPRAGREIQMFAYQTEGAKAFSRYLPNKPPRIMMQGEREVEFAYFVTKERENLQLSIKGFKAMKLEE